MNYNELHLIQGWGGGGGGDRGSQTPGPGCSKLGHNNLGMEWNLNLDMKADWLDDRNNHFKFSEMNKENYILKNNKKGTQIKT